MVDDRRIISVSDLIREINKLAKLPRDHLIESDANCLDGLADAIEQCPETNWGKYILPDLRRIAKSLRDYA